MKLHQPRAYHRVIQASALERFYPQSKLQIWRCPQAAAAKLGKAGQRVKLTDGVITAIGVLCRSPELTDDEALVLIRAEQAAAEQD